MGGRGRRVGESPSQLNLDYFQTKASLQDILVHSEAMRKDEQYIVSNSEMGRSKSTSTAYRKCYCCEEYTIPIQSINAQCPVCGWIDDEIQNYNPNITEGKNPISLNEAKQKYAKYIKEK